MIERFVTPGMGANCYLVSCEKTGKAILVDPGAGSRQIFDWVKKSKKDVQYIVLTHGHYDHIGAVEDLRKKLGVQVAIHKEDAEMLVDPQKNLSFFSGLNLSLEEAEIILEDNQILEVGEMKIKVIHTPGHTPGGICLLTPEGLISGDTLFDCSIGRADFPGGNLTTLVNSIKERLLVLDDDVRVFPGHETETTIGREKRFNPYLNGTFNANWNF
ncbi:MAG: MBL fold metallo-hydrolase [Desulfitobacteriia bacterium]|jgi:hydroxyacylglutathione hydrolase